MPLAPQGSLDFDKWLLGSPILGVAALSVSGVFMVSLPGRKCWNVLCGRDSSENSTTKVHCIFNDLALVKVLEGFSQVLVVTRSNKSILLSWTHFKGRHVRTSQWKREIYRDERQVILRSLVVFVFVLFFGWLGFSFFFHSPLSPGKSPNKKPKAKPLIWCSELSSKWKQNV